MSMVKARELISRASAGLAVSGIDEHVREAEALMLHVLGITREKLYAHDPEPTQQERERFALAVGRRMKREPLHYITGSIEFAGLVISIQPGVLVPRPETEAIVEELRKRMPDAGKVLDLCTGSGCLAVAIASRLKSADVWATDISPAAVDCCRRNAEALGLNNVRALEGELFRPVAGEKFDVIVSNPPYIPSAEIAGLMPEVSIYEPRLALDGGPDGLEFLRRIFAHAGEHLNHVKHGGLLILELGAGQAEDVRLVAGSAGFVIEKVLDDLAGHPRTAVAIMPQ
jgi:release factor glutamine methyltransferase